MRTKWDILQERVEQAREAVKKAEAYLEGLEKTRCGLECTGCGKDLHTEADFAQHFVIPDERYLNLGNCPHADKDKLPPYGQR